MRLILLWGFIVSFLFLPLPTAAQDFKTFKPRPSQNTELNYEYLDYVLDNIVIDLGLSDRERRLNRPDGVFTVRHTETVGHKSPFRMEGSRILFNNLPRDFAPRVSEYRVDLQKIGSDLPIQSLSRNEQLAYWFNLHNIALIELMAKEHPFKRIDRLTIGPEKLNIHDVKFIEVQNSQLSLRDIREKIIYPNWNNPDVIYGFFLGDIGGPSLRTQAYTGDNVATLLDMGANEFTNSLRGFEQFKGKLNVSQLYVDVYNFYFPDFQKDLRTHFKTHMRPEVFLMASAAQDFTIGKYYTNAASVSAGRSQPRFNNNIINSTEFPSLDTLYTTQDLRDSKSALADLLLQLGEKRRKLRDLGLLDGEVIIEVIPTEDKEVK